MIKKLSTALCVALITMFVLVGSVYASDFGIEKTTPKDGATDVQIENMGVKVFFNKDVYSKEYSKQNQKACKLLNKKGKEVKCRVVFNSKDKKVALILAGDGVTIDSKSDYKVVIDEDFTAADGEKLGKTETIKFKTLNPASSMKISMIMMGVMIVGMIFVSSKSMKKKEAEDGNKKEERFNPYKVAKETGKSVEEVMATYQKKKAKEEARKSKKQAELDEYDDLEEVEAELPKGHYKVARVRKISEAGSTFQAPVKKQTKQNKQNSNKNKKKKKK